MKTLTFSPQARQSITGRLSSVKRTVAGTMAGLSFLFAPIAQRALAQPPKKEQVKPGYKISGTEVRIKGNATPGHLSRGDKPAILTLEGPTELNVAAYPIVKSYRVSKEKAKEIQITYMLDGVLYHAKATLSNLADTKLVSHELKKTETICDAVLFRIAVPEGKHQFHIISHDAVIEIGDDLRPVDISGKLDDSGVILAGAIERDYELELVPLVPPEPVQKTTPAPKKTEKPLAKPVPEPEMKKKPEPLVKPEMAEPRPVQNMKMPEAAKSRLVELNGKRFGLSGLNTGEVNEIELVATPLVTDMLALAVGSNLSSHERILEKSNFTQSMRSFSANLEAGLGISKNGHSAFLVGFGGIRIIGGMLEAPGLGTDPTDILEAEFGARAGYDYKNLVGFVLMGSNNPFSPGKLELYASLPYWYLDDNFPRLGADVRWLHLLREDAVQDIIGKTSLDVTDVQSRLTLSIPLAKLGPIIPTVLGGVDLSTADGLEVTGHLGAALGADILDTFKLEAGAAYGLDGRLLILLNGRLLH